jgi:hypothetical protein
MSNDSFAMDYDLEAIERGEDAHARSLALSTMIELLKLFAGETIHDIYNGTTNTPVSADATRAILEAAYPSLQHSNYA